MPEAPIWLAESEVVSLIDLGEAITTARDGLQALATGAAVSMPKAQITFSGGTLHATGAASSSAGYACSKTWAHTRSGATPLVLLWSISDGQLLAVIEAFALGQYRTAAISGVATDLLASAGARELCVCGTGAQALMQVAAVHAVRDIERVRVWSPRAESRQRFCLEVSKALSIKAVVAPSAHAAADGADVVTLITRAPSPFLDASAVDEGAHVNAAGAISLDRAEFAPTLLDRCDIVAVDDVTAARAWSTELREYFGEDGTRWAEVSGLADLVAKAYQRAASADVTVFKAMGLGLLDLSIAAFVYERAVVNDIGLRLPSISRSRPRLRSLLKERN